MTDFTPKLSEQLYQHLTHLVRQRDPYLASEGHFYVREYVRQQFAQWGEVQVQEFKVQGKVHQNLLVNLTEPGSEKAGKPLVLIGAHYDAVPGTPGADDNASGVATLLEIGRRLVAMPCRFPVQLVAFDMEEYGLLGSTHYASLLREQQRSLRLMLSLEMLGYCDPTPGCQRYPAGLERFYPDRGDFIALVGNLPTLPDLIHLAHHIRQVGTPCEWLPAGKRGLIVPATRQSDHAPFWDRNYRAVMVTDTSFMRNPYYHTPRDCLETLDLKFMAGVCQGLVEGIQSL